MDHIRGAIAVRCRTRWRLHPCGTLAGSFPRAVAASIARLENLGVRLFNRTTRSIALTEGAACSCSTRADGPATPDDAVQALRDRTGARPDWCG